MMDERYVVGIDLGGTKIAAALFNAAGSLLQREQVETAGCRNARELADCMCGLVRKVSGGKTLHGVGLASPGAVDTRAGIVRNGTNLPEWNDVPIKQWMEDKLAVEVKVVNDANAAAWGEYVRGAGGHEGSMVYVTFSTGIGAGIVMDGELLLGAHSFAGELGHLIVDPSGPVCSCGRHGCWEVFASGTAIRGAALRRIGEEDSLITQLAAVGGEAVSSRHVFEAAAAGDAMAQEVIDEAIRYMAIGLANIVHTFNPDRIVIGGGVSRAGELLFPALRAQTDKLVMEPYRGTFQIIPAALKDDVGLIGAAALFGQ